MFLSRVSVRRKVAVASFMLVLVIFGVFSYFRLGMDLMPSVDVPYVNVSVTVPGANPDELEVEVARRLEDAVSGVGGLKHVSTSIGDNVCSLLLEFTLDTNVDAAAQEVREKIDTVINDLPADAERPVITKFDPNSSPVVTIMAVGDMPLDRLYDYADDRIAPKFSAVPGVADVDVTGSGKMELHVILDPVRLASFGLTASGVAEMISAANVKIPAGRIDDSGREITVTFDSGVETPADVLDLEIGEKAGSRVYLRDIGEVFMSAEKSRTAAFLNDLPAIRIRVVKKSDANALEVVNGARRVFESLQKPGALPGGVKLVWFSDDGLYIEANVRDAWGSVFLGIVLTCVILLLFLRDIRSTFIAALTMPFSIVVTFIVMQFFSYTFNNMTLLALGTCVGTLVSNSIVVLESIFSRLASGLSRDEAADEGTALAAPPVFASAATNVVVFLPIALMTSIVGRFFTPFAVTMTAATLVSLFVSFTLTPLLASSLGTGSAGAPKRVFLFSSLLDAFGYGYAKTEKLYVSSLDFFLRHSWSVVLFSLLLVVGTAVFIAPRVGMSFMPQTDRSELSARLEFPVYNNIESTKARVLKLESKIRSLPFVENTSSSIGKVSGAAGQSSNGVNLAEISVKTLPKSHRSETLSVMREKIGAVLNGETDLVSSVNIPSSVGGSSSELEYEIAGPDSKILNSTVKKLVEKVRKSGLASDISTSVRVLRSEIRFIPVRSVMNDTGVTSAQAGRILRANIEGVKAGTCRSGGRTFDVRVKLAESDGSNQVKAYTISSKDGRPVQFDTIAVPENSVMPSGIDRRDKERVVRLYANPAKGVSLGELASFVGDEAERLLPHGYDGTFIGQVEKMDETSRDFAAAIFLAAILAYLVIAGTMESWSLPLVVLFTLPLAFIGMELALYYAGIDLSMMGLLGCVMLVGIIVNNAILMMDELKVKLSNGMECRSAMLEACRSKFRPIVMTTLAALGGIVPMAFGNGLGSELRQSAGMCIVGGLVSAGLLSVYVIPCLYIAFANLKKRRI